MVLIKLLHSMNSKSTPATSSFRWAICARRFFSTIFNCLDRQMLALIKPILVNGLFRCGITRYSHANPVAQGFPAL